MEITIIFLFFLISVQGFFLETVKKIYKNQANILFAIIFFLQLFIPAAFRDSSVYNDSQAYAEHFLSIDPKSVFDINPLERFEVGYQILENFIKLYISDNPVALFFVTSLIIQSSYVYTFYKYSRSLWFSIFLYIGLCHYFFVVSGIRQAVAIAVFNFAFYYLINKKYLGFFLVTLLAAQLHSSAYTLLLLPLFSRINFNKFFFLIYTLVLVLGYFLLDQIFVVFSSFFPNYAKDYIQNEWISDSKTGTLVILSTYLIGLVFIKRTFNKVRMNEEKKMMMLYYLLLVMLLILSIKVSNVARLINYFIPFSIILLSNACSVIKDYQNRLVIYVFWVSFLLLQIFVILTERPEWFMVTPYKFSW